MSRFRVKRFRSLAAFFVFFFAISALRAAEVLELNVTQVLKQTPELQHKNDGRLPIITWPPFVDERGIAAFNEGKPLAPDVYRALGKRGLTQRIPLKPEFIPMAKAIQEAGLPVVFMEGDGGNGPGGEAPGTLHQLPADFEFGKSKEVMPCPMVEDGWKVRGQRVRATIKAYKDAGIHVTAAWLDWEGEPNPGKLQFRESAACARCREQIPAEFLKDEKDYNGFARRRNREMLSKYMVEPILEAYPQCSITNWSLVFSSTELPGYNWWGSIPLAPMGMEKFTAANPVVYGNTEFRSLWPKMMDDRPFDQANMDRLYVQQMFRQISRHEENAQKQGVHIASIPWVIRYCPDDDDPKIPILSRSLYQEILRHSWLRGADSMQIFNEPRAGHMEICGQEVEDVVRIYDEMLAQRDILNAGEPFNFALPSATDDAAIWSGLRLKNRAMVRAFTLGTNPATASVQPWPNLAAVELPAPPAGKTYLLTVESDKVKVEPQ